MISSRFAASIESSVNRLAAAAEKSPKEANRHARAMLRDIQMVKIASEILRVAEEEEMELSYWDTVEGDDVLVTVDEAKLKEDPAKLEPALKLVKRKIDTFIKSLSEGPQSSDSDDSDVFTSAPSFR